MNVNEQTAWECGGPSIRASKPRRSEIRKARGMARRVKERQHWAGIFAGMSLAVVLIESTTNEIPPLGGPQTDGPLDGPGGGEGEDQDQDQQMRAERNRPLSEEHKNKRRKLTQLELRQMILVAPDKNG